MRAEEMYWLGLFPFEDRLAVTSPPITRHKSGSGSLPPITRCHGRPECLCLRTSPSFWTLGAYHSLDALTSSLFLSNIILCIACTASPPSTASQQPSSMDGSFGTSKVAIPKLKRHDSNRRPSIERSSHPRISKACDSCRIRKIRCSGERPRCRNCLDQPSPCTYPLARQDRLKKSVLQTVW